MTGDHNVTHLHPPSITPTALAVLLALVVIGGLIAWYSGDDDSDMPPLAATVEYTPSEDDCDGWTFPGKKPEEIPVPPGEPTAEWAHQHGGIDDSITRLRLVVQGMNSHDVVLHNMRVVEQRKAPLPPAGTDVALALGCGGDLPERDYRVMLGSDSPEFELVTRKDDRLSVIQKPFGYKVSATDPEIFAIEANAAVDDDFTQCDCLIAWKLALDWAHKGKQGTLIVDDKGAPFKTKSTELNSPYPSVVKREGSWK